MPILNQEPEEEQYVPQNYGQFYNNQAGVVLPSDVIKYRLESDDIVENLEHDLKGEAFVNGQWKKIYTAEINQAGLVAVRSIVSRYCNRSCFLGNLSTDQINYKCMMLKKELALLLFKKYKIYGIDKAKRSILIRKIVDTIHLSLSRSEDALESQTIGQSTNRQEIVHEDKTPPQSSSGLFRFFKANVMKKRESARY